MLADNALHSMVSQQTWSVVIESFPFKNPPYRRHCRSLPSTDMFGGFDPPHFFLTTEIVTAPLFTTHEIATLDMRLYLQSRLSLRLA